jgi:hypothetical protein
MSVLDLFNPPADFFQGDQNWTLASTSANCSNSVSSFDLDCNPLRLDFLDPLPGGFAPIVGNIFRCTIKFTGASYYVRFGDGWQGYSGLYTVGSPVLCPDGVDTEVTFISAGEPLPASNINKLFFQLWNNSLSEPLMQTSSGESPVMHISALTMESLAVDDFWRDKVGVLESA